MDQERLEDRGRLAVIAMGSARRLGDDLVDDPEAKQVAAGQLQCVGGFGCVLAAFQRMVAQPSGLMTE